VSRRLTPQERALRAITRTPDKYNARKVHHPDGYVFDSQAEARRYDELRLLEFGNRISGLAVHPHYPITVNGQEIGVYTPDFAYQQNGALVVEDVKSKATRTEAYRLRKKLLKALYDIDVVEVFA
jgi:hypothetical protein